MDEQPPKKTRGKAKPKKTDRPALIAQYALERAKGTTKKKAAEKLEISRRQVYHLETAAPELLNDLIKEAAEQLARQALPQAVEVIKDTLNETLQQGVTGIYTYQQLNEDTNQLETLQTYDSNLHKAQLGLRKLGIAASEDVLKGVGILNTPTAAPVMLDLTIQQTNLLLPAVRNVLNALSLDALNPDEENTKDVTP